MKYRLFQELWPLSVSKNRNTIIYLFVLRSVNSWTFNWSFMAWNMILSEPHSLSEARLPRQRVTSLSQQQSCACIPDRHKHIRAMYTRTGTQNRESLTQEKLEMRFNEKAVQTALIRCRAWLDNGLTSPS